MRDSDENSWVYFEEALIPCSVEDEVCTLSRTGLGITLGHIRKVYDGEIDPFKLQEWNWFRGIPLFKVEYRGELMIYAVESRYSSGRRGLKISIMFAGLRANNRDNGWDGNDDSLWRIVSLRCSYHFA